MNPEANTEQVRENSDKKPQLHPSVLTPTMVAASVSEAEKEGRWFPDKVCYLECLLPGTSGDRVILVQGPCFTQKQMKSFVYTKNHRMLNICSTCLN